MAFDVVLFAFTLLWDNLSRNSCMRSRQPQVFWRLCYSSLARSLVLRSSPRIFEQKRDCSLSIPLASYGPEYCRYVAETNWPWAPRKEALKCFLPRLSVRDSAAFDLLPRLKNLNLPCEYDDLFYKKINISPATRSIISASGSNIGDIFDMRTNALSGSLGTGNSVTLSLYSYTMLYHENQRKIVNFKNTSFLEEQRTLTFSHASHDNNGNDNVNR